MADVYHIEDLAEEGMTEKELMKKWYALIEGLLKKVRDEIRYHGSSVEPDYYLTLVNEKDDDINSYAHIQIGPKGGWSVSKSNLFDDSENDYEEEFTQAVIPSNKMLVRDTGWITFGVDSREELKTADAFIEMEIKHFTCARLEERVF